MPRVNAVALNTSVLFITPHAIEQFQKRIARLSDDWAREVIRAGVSQAANVRVLPDGETLRVRTVKPFPYEFRAYCVFDHQRGHRVVTTIVWGDSRATRQRKYVTRLSLSEYDKLKFVEQKRRATNEKRT